MSDKPNATQVLRDLITKQGQEAAEEMAGCGTHDPHAETSAEPTQPTDSDILPGLATEYVSHAADKMAASNSDDGQPVDVVEAAAGTSLTERAGYTTNMKSSAEGGFPDFDPTPENIARVAMMQNDTHPDLIGACRAVLVNSGRTEEQLALFDSHFLIATARGKSVLAQRTALNSFWTVQFAHFGVDGFGPRQLLVGVGGDADWLKWFQTQPLDFIIAKNLPMKMIGN